MGAAVRGPSRPALSSRPRSRASSRRSALLRAIDEVTAERAGYVEKHRARLTKEARQAAEKARDRAVRLLGELEDARAELVQARRTELWAALYPSAEVGQEPVFGQLAGGLKRIVEALGLKSVVPAERVFEALREDLEWVSDASSVAQRAKLGGPKPLNPADLDRTRNQRIEAHTSLRTQRNQDDRVGELNHLRRKL